MPARSDPPSAQRSDAQGQTRVERWQRSVKEARWPPVALFFASFAEAIILPIPIEIVALPLMLARRHQVWLLATVTLAGNLVAAMPGYGIGYFLFDRFGDTLMAAIGNGERLAAFQERFEEEGFLAIVVITASPLPFQLAALAAGAAAYPFLMFILAIALARGVRYYGLALLVMLLGRRLLALWHRWRGRSR
jgi:membrane protein YqaA with SNARE-associated domain